MRIGGLQKLSLLDYPDQTCCTVFTAGCNFRCPFCHNGDLVLSPFLPPACTPDELLAFLSKRQGLLDGVCISGGEPLLQEDLEELMTDIKKLGFLIKLDTNGSRPDGLKKIIEKGLVDYVAMDIKSSLQGYAAAIGISNFDTAAVEASARLLLFGKINYEFRTTVVRELHCESDFEAIGDWLSGASRYYLQGFVDSGQVIQPGLSPCTPQEMEKFLQALQHKIPAARLREA